MKKIIPKIRLIIPDSKGSVKKSLYNIYVKINRVIIELVFFLKLVSY